VKLIADEMISPKIVRAITEIALEKSWIFESIAGSKYQGQSDEDWIMTFARHGGKCIISADRQMLKRPQLLHNIHDTGLIGMYLQPRWAGYRKHKQAAHILYWWKDIELTPKQAPPGSIWKVPNNFKDGNIIHVPFNNETADIISITNDRS
jgi:hypothetical protein